MNRVYIRVDGNDIIAIGHIMRCLSIAESLKKQNISVTFILADDKPVDILKEREYEYIILNSAWNDLNLETDKMIAFIQRNNVEILIIDSYYITMEYLQKLSQYTKILYIDDLNKFAYPVNTVIHYRIFTDKKSYMNQYSSNVRIPDFLLGSQYVPLRDEFRYEKFDVKSNVEKVLISTGGTDQLNVSGGLIKQLMNTEETKNLEIHVIVGRYNKNKDYLYQLKQLYSNVILHENVTDISYWMRYCDVAISASGVTLYEMCACGIPTICLSVAKNQSTAQMWEKRGYMLYAGNAETDYDACIETAIQYLKKYQNDYSLRVEKSRKVQTLVDGMGTQRIAEYIKGLF